MRNIALDQSPRGQVSNELLELCDEVRESLLEQGVEIMDSERGECDGWRPSLPKMANKQTISSNDINTRQQIDLHKVPLEELFKVGTYDGEFSQFDQNGVPTHNADGSEVSKRLLKKLLKKREIHVKRLARKIQT